MEDEFGKEKTVALIDAYIAALPKEGFRAFASSYMGKDLSMRFEQWVAPRPQINYKLGRHRKKKVGLQYKHAITIEQETAASIIEPVTLKVTFKDKTYQTQQWFSTEKKHTFELITDQKIKAIEIDPQERLLETSKSDNRRPAYWKFVILSMFVEYDFEEQQPLFMIFGQLRKRYGGLDRFDMGGYSQFNSYGANFGYTRLFGKAIDALRLSHGVRFALNLNGLAQDVALVQTSPDPTIIQVTDSGYASDVSVSYVYGNQLSYINPLQGMYGGLTLRVSNPLLGSQYSYRMINFNTAGIVQLHPNHLWGIRFSIGSSGAGEMPSQLQYRLGGIASMRGLPLTNDKFSGKHIVLLTNEYRHFLSQDMDLNLGLFRIRKIQGALFSNVGNTTHTVQEQADRKAGLITDVSGFMDLFDPRDLKADVGYGLRLHIHYFGVSPSLISFDVAHSITEKGYGYLYYLGVNQTF
ncbi:MAG: BamA/TamA family outer membrane protein [Bdellovibrionota bacterium]